MKQNFSVYNFYICRFYTWSALTVSSTFFEHNFPYLQFTYHYELTVPWDENREEAQERKKNRYETLRADCVKKGWICHVIPIDVGCRVSIGHTVISFLSKIGIISCSLKVASNQIQTTVQYASSWIWSKARSFLHE